MRLQFELPEPKFEEIKRLMAKTGMGSYAELFNNAMSLMKWATATAGDGWMIAAYDEKNDRMRELVMPFLQHVAEQKALEPVAPEPVKPAAKSAVAK